MDFASKPPWWGTMATREASKQHGKLGFNTSIHPTRLNHGVWEEIWNKSSLF